MTPNDPTAPTGVNVDPQITPGAKPSGQPVIDPGRDALVKKYEATYFAQPEPEPAQSEPAAVIEPVPAEPGQVPDTNQVLQSVVAELAALKAQLTPPPKVEAPKTQEDWLKLLADGKKSEGEKALAALLGPEIEKAAVAKALQQITVEREIDTFASKVRSDNADIIQMEPYVAQAAFNRIQQVMQNNPTADYVTVYKQAVTAEIENARKLVQTFRGAGKQEAVTRQTQVLSTPTIKPNAVNLERDAPKADGEPEVETPQSYMAKRQAMHAKNSGLSV